MVILVQTDEDEANATLTVNSNPVWPVYLYPNESICLNSNITTFDCRLRCQVLSESNIYNIIVKDLSYFCIYQNSDQIVKIQFNLPSHSQVGYSYAFGGDQLPFEWVGESTIISGQNNDKILIAVNSSIQLILNDGTNETLVYSLTNQDQINRRITNLEHNCYEPNESTKYNYTTNGDLCSLICIANPNNTNSSQKVLNI